MKDKFNKSVNNLIDKCISLHELEKEAKLMTAGEAVDNGVAEEHESRCDELMLAVKPFCTEFFRWWYNQPGTNTDQAFDEWYKKLKSSEL